MKLDSTFVANNFMVLANGKLQYQPGCNGGFGKIASPSDFDGSVGSIWVMGSEGLERDEHPFGDLELALDSHLNERGYLEKQLRDKAEEISSLQDELGDDLFGTTAAPTFPGKKWYVLPIGLISLRTGINKNIFGNMFNENAGEQLTLLKYEKDGSIRGVLGGDDPIGTKAMLFHHQTGHFKGDVTVIGRVPITPEGFKQAEQMAGKGAIGGYVFK